MKVIDNASSKMHLSEGGQGQLEMKFAFYDTDRGEVVTPFCKCKDYFTDLFWSRSTGNDVSVYGFVWKKTKEDETFKKDKFSLAIRLHPCNKVETDLENVKQENLDNILSLLHIFEKANNFELSIGEICEECKHFIITFDKKWTNIPYTVSALFLYLRLGFHYDQKSDIREYYTAGDNKRFISPHDQMYVKSSINIIEDMKDGILDTSQKYEDYSSGGAAHNGSGVVGYRSKYKRPEQSAPAEVVTQ